MIRRSTLAVLVVLALAVAALLLLQNSPNSLLSATPTPASTTAPPLLSGWNAQEIAVLAYQQQAGSEIRLTRGADGGWMYGSEGAAPVGVVEQLSSELLAMRITVQIANGLNLQDFLLENPARAITLQNANGKTATIQIGGLTPTQSGYYVKVDQNAPVIVASTAMDTILQLFEESKPIQPAPDGSADPTVTPNP